MYKKPAWLDMETWNKLMDQYGGTPTCYMCGRDEPLAPQDCTVDHIVPRHRDGPDDLSNLRFMCRRHNSQKGARDDIYWQQRFYWDNKPDIAALRTAQRQEAYEKILHYKDWFTRPLSQISRNLYVLAWIVGAGKTLAVPSIGFALNHIIQRDCGLAHPRTDRILVLAKEQAVRDQLVRDLEADITKYGICGIPPRVGKITREDMWHKGNYDKYDIIVTCIHQLWKQSGRQRLPQVLAHFPLVFFDEPHYGFEQVMKIVDSADSSVCFGLTGTPIKARGSTLQRCILFSLYDYDSAVEFDNSMKLVPSDYGKIVEVIDIDEADTLDEGEYGKTNTTDMEGYPKNIAPAKSVAERVVRWVYDRDTELTTIVQKGLWDSLLPAIHRPNEAIVRLEYPVHAMIKVETIDIAIDLCEVLNEMFDQNRHRYSLDKGYRAEVVYSEYETADGKPKKGRPLRPKHPWLRYKNLARLDKACARFLIVIGIGREGVNNPVCGVIGVACKATSVVEHSQRTVGRQVRSNDESLNGTLLVPPKSLDTIKIITHKAFCNDAAIKGAIEFTRNMSDWLSALPTMSDLIAGYTIAKGAESDDEVALTEADMVGIAGALGFSGNINRVSTDLISDIVTTYGGQSKKKRDKVSDWIHTVRMEPEEAWNKLRHVGEIASVPVILREYPNTKPTDDELCTWINTDGELSSLSDHILSSNPVARLITEKWYQDHVQQFHIGEFVPKITVKGIKNLLVWRVKHSLGDYFEKSKRAEGILHASVWSGMRMVLAVPENKTLSIGSDWDVPQCHVILRRPEIARQIVGYARGRLITNGFCPALATAFRVGDDEND